MSHAATEGAVRAIARWCWPEAYAPGARESAHAKKDRAVGRNSDRDWPLVRAAELVLIERGLAEEYGYWLRGEVHKLGTIIISGEPSGHPSIAEALAYAATAPLSARVRAMAAVIRALPKDGE